MNATELLYPPDRVAGCLPRKSKPGEVCPMFADKIKVIPQREWDDYVGEISLKPFVKEILNQGSVGSCATEATTQAVMISRAFSELPHVSLNPWFIYHHTSGGVDRGSSIDENLEFAREKGIAPISVWPRSAGWQGTPTEEAYAEALKYRIVEFYDISTIEEMVTALLKGFPVVYGSNGHAVCKIEHQNDRQGLDINSWGEAWGDGGFGVWASYRAVNWKYGAWAIRTSTEGVS